MVNTNQTSVINEPKLDVVIEQKADMEKPTKTEKGKCGLILQALLIGYILDWFEDNC